MRVSFTLTNDVTCKGSVQGYIYANDNNVYAIIKVEEYDGAYPKENYVWNIPLKDIRWLRT